MGKTPKLKKKAGSIHSRAARREVSPSLNLDKSLKTLKPPTETRTVHSNVLAAHDVRISKKSKSKPMSRQKRLRKQRIIERADVVLDKLGEKVQKSASRGKKIKERRATWDDLNEQILGIHHPEGSLASTSKTHTKKKRIEVPVEPEAESSSSAPTIDGSAIPILPGPSEQLPSVKD